MRRIINKDKMKKYMTGAPREANSAVNILTLPCLRNQIDMLKCNHLRYKSIKGKCDVAAKEMDYNSTTCQKIENKKINK